MSNQAWIVAIAISGIAASLVSTAYFEFRQYSMKRRMLYSLVIFIAFAVPLIYLGFKGR